MIAEKLVDAEVPFLSVGVEDGTQFFRRNGVESVKSSLKSHGFSESVSSAFFAEFSQPLQSERDMPGWRNSKEKSSRPAWTGRLTILVLLTRFWESFNHLELGKLA